MLALESGSEDTVPKPLPSPDFKKIGRQGGPLKFNSDISVTVPPDAVSTDTTFSLETYIDRRMMPPVVVHSEEVVLSPAVYLSSSHIGEFNNPIKLTLLPEVPLKSSDPVNGWVLELKSSHMLSDGKPDKWRPEVKLNTNTGISISHSSSVQYDSSSSTIQLHHLGKCYAWTGKPLSKRCRRRIRYVVFGKGIKQHKWILQALIIHGPRNVTYEAVERILGNQKYIKLTDKSAQIQQHEILTLNLKNLDKWQVCSEEFEASEIHTDRIWHSKLDESLYCFPEIVLEDQSCSSGFLEFKIDASVESKTDLSPTEIKIRHPVFLRQSSTLSGKSQSGTVIPYDNCSVSFL